MAAAAVQAATRASRKRLPAKTRDPLAKGQPPAAEAAAKADGNDADSDEDPLYDLD